MKIAFCPKAVSANTAPCLRRENLRFYTRCARHSNGVLRWMAARRGAFTIIELLVVVSIIAILAALLLPALSRAKQKGQQAACLSNLHQQALAVLTYAVDNDDRIMPCSYNNPTNSTNPLRWTGLQASYMSLSNRVYLCPSDQKSKRISYGVNELAFVDMTTDLGDPSPPPPNRLSSFTTPSTTVMSGDLGTGDDMTTQRPDASIMNAPSSPLEAGDDDKARPSARHAMRCDLVFMEGHVEPLQLKQFYQMQNPLNKWFLPYVGYVGR